MRRDAQVERNRGKILPGLHPLDRLLPELTFTGLASVTMNYSFGSDLTDMGIDPHDTAVR